MVDRERRKKLALHLRHLSVGLISNDQFEESIKDDISGNWLPEQYHRSKLAKSGNDDTIIKPMLEFCWAFYDDTRNHTLTESYSLSPESLTVIARCLFFLQTEREFD